LQARSKLERIVREAVLHDRFELHYQPLFEISERRLLGFEALIRLPAEDGTLIPPLVFISVAEELQLIDKIGAWVLREACGAAATWPEDLTVAVNLSPAQFLAGGVSDIVATALKETGLPAQRLELEITETLLLGDSAAVMAELQTLKAMGVAIVMDDFGTGYSSLSYLWRFPFDKIKIDRSFMQGFNGLGRDAKTVVKTIIALGYSRRRSGPRVLFRPASSRLGGQRQYSRGFSEGASSIVVVKKQTASGQIGGRTTVPGRIIPTPRVMAMGLSQKVGLTYKTEQVLFCYGGEQSSCGSDSGALRYRVAWHRGRERRVVGQKFAYESSGGSTHP
jgi:EAL domain-containing protein (putative c-di-GMP-specific phosphodiesterase class I)